MSRKRRGSRHDEPRLTPDPAAVDRGRGTARDSGDIEFNTRPVSFQTVSNQRSSSPPSRPTISSQRVATRRNASQSVTSQFVISKVMAFPPHRMRIWTTR
jgi:hypothetical protein